LKLEIYKLNKEKVLEKSIKIKKEIIKEVTENLNNMDLENFYFYVDYEDDLLDYMFSYLNDNDIIVKKNKSNKLKNVKKIIIDLKFENFDFNENYRIITCDRFSNIFKYSKWSNIEVAKKIVLKIKEYNKEKNRNIKIYEVENLQNRYISIYDKKRRETEYYLDRESFLDNVLEDRIKNKKIIEGALIDKDINIDKIRLDFLTHLLKKIKIRANLKYIIKKESWEEERALIETIVPAYNKNLLSIEEQKALINRIFPSIQYINNFFYNNEILKEKPSIYNVNNHKLDIIVSIINKSKSAGFLVTNMHYDLMHEAVDNHDLRKLMNFKIKKDKLHIM
jgi:hypothetical protein